MQCTPTSDGSQTLFSERYGETFHSVKGALTESRHIFIQTSGVEKRLRHQLYTQVLEIGFGTGLNFFLSADLALTTGAALRFTSLEHTLLPADTVHPLGYEAYLEHPELLRAYLTFRETLPIQVEPGAYRFNFEPVGLELRIGDATAQTLSNEVYDALYQDAFSPTVNPELWTENFLAALFRSLKAGGSLTSYCVKGEVRRSLNKLGFQVEKRPGPPGGKREMLKALKP